MSNVMRGKRYAIDSERLLKDKDIYYLSYIGKIGTGQLSSQLKEGRLSYHAFNSLEENGFDIRNYWIVDSEINTVQINESLMYSMIETTAKYKKLAYKLDGFMNVRLFKPLKKYMEFCDAMNTSYLTFCDDEDYVEYFKKVEEEQFKSKTAIKPKAFIKEHSQEERAANNSNNENMDSKLIEFLSQPIKWHYKDYGDDLSGITSCLGRIDRFESIATLENYVKKHRQMFLDDYQSALMAEWIEKKWHVRIYRPTYTEHLLHPKLAQMICQGIYR